ncbi:nucleotidyl transferase AbiEii/AbiGii toxin family protein [Hymenobacter profundi]|uniref:Nucleotidyl transferase AbiEii/AbiGii toxin family protein n=1 Tax=Hymenobacter profundi TaxID=1982110 RepID=A0ABS6X4X8_9BACT|nr:nucleotidyl transferase AbiEii/AbiGii toxin family protein [Hymenobacter profundi]MBW3130759.1 nucleotidyl transferase AbiEii/AbiGii toxin family protein [Hymenobacter profundi]
MDIEVVNNIKRLAIIALASDDELVETIVLKGGNAIDLTYEGSETRFSRPSYDLDFSIEAGDFAEDLEVISARIEKTLQQTYQEHGYELIDYKFVIKPKVPPQKTADFWGGYLVQFKVVPQAAYQQNTGNDRKQRMAAVAVKPNLSSVFEIEFSKYEYVGQKAQISVDNYTVYVYTPEMIVFEKVRALCQQLPQYAEVIPSHSPRARARDFYDIYFIMEDKEIDVLDPANIELLKHIFASKKVPVEFIAEIKNNKSIHRDNWESVKDTVAPTEELRDFDFYFNYVVDAYEQIIGL